MYCLFSWKQPIVRANNFLMGLQIFAVASQKPDLRFGVSSAVLYRKDASRGVLHKECGVFSSKSKPQWVDAHGRGFGMRWYRRLLPTQNHRINQAGKQL